MEDRERDDMEHVQHVTLFQLKIGFNALAKLSEEYVGLIAGFPDAYNLITQEYIDNTWQRLENQRAHVLKSIDTFCKNSNQSKKLAVKSLLDRHENHDFTWHPISAKIDGYLKQSNRKGAAVANTKKSEKKISRQKLIQDYVNSNPSPDIKNISFEAHLAKKLQFKVSEKTINNDLKELGLLSLKKKLERR